MLKKHVLRFSMLMVLALAGATPAFADDCEDYCEGYADGFCESQGKTANYQGCTGGPGNYQCYFGCVPPV